MIDLRGSKVDTNDDSILWRLVGRHAAGGLAVLVVVVDEEEMTVTKRDDGEERRSLG
jgi:hypothetical protein